MPALYYRFRTHNLGLKCGGFTVPRGVFGPGLSIAHPGSVTVNHTARVGQNCRIHEGVCIGATSGGAQAAVIGDNVFIGSGAKIIGPVTIASMWPSARGRWWSAPSPSPAPPGRASRRGRFPTGTPTGI